MADEVREALTPDYSELGTAGTRILSGIPYEEFNPDLASGVKAFNAYNQMRFDATPAAGYKAIELPIRSAEHFIEPASDDPKDIDKADFIHHNLFEFGSQSMDDVVRLAMTMLPFGFSWHEIIYKLIENGDYAGKVGWDRFAWRSQLTKWRWNMGEVDGRQELLSVTQLAPPYYAQIDIPRNKMLLFVNDQEGDNYDGWSIFRAAYKNYWYRDTLYKIQAIGLERAYMGIPVVKLLGNFSEEMKALALSIAQGIRTDDNVGVTLPANDMELEMLHTTLGAGKEMQDAIVYHDRQILKSMLAQWLDLGSAGSSGSWALSNDHSELFLYAINSKANYMDEVFNLNPGIPQLIRFNYPDWQTCEMPRLTHGRIGQQSLEALGRTLMALGKFGFVTPDDATEDAFRQMLDLPEREETMTPEALRSLITGVVGRVAIGRKHNSKRPLTPDQITAQANLIKAQATGQTPSADLTAAAAPADDQDGSDDLNMAEARAIINDAIRRAPWGRSPVTTARGRVQAQLAEQFAEQLEAFSRPHGIPERPSVRMARLRKPYQLHETAASMREGDGPVRLNEDASEVIKQVKQRAARGDLKSVPAEKRGRGNTVSLHSAVLSKAAPHISAALRNVSKPRVAMSEGERPTEVGRRDPAHIHDQNGKVDDQPCVAIDLNETITPALSYPLDAPPYPGVKQLLDRLKAQGACIHCTSAGLYIGDKHDQQVQDARIAMCEAYATEYGLPVDIWLPKAPADVYVDDRMVPMPKSKDMAAVGAMVDSVLKRRFDMGQDGLWHRKDNADVGHPITDWPDGAEVGGDQPRGFSGPIVDIDVHGTTLNSTSSERRGAAMPGAVDAISQLYDSGVTVHLSCAGWNPATKDDPAVVEKRLAGQRQQLRSEGIPYDRLTSKDHCEVYIDDKGVAFTTWDETLPQILAALAAQSGPRPEWTPTGTPGDVDE